MDGSLSNKLENFVDDLEKNLQAKETRSTFKEAGNSRSNRRSRRVIVFTSSGSTNKSKGGATSPRDGATGAGAYDRRAMHSGHSGLADPKSRQHRSSIRDQDFNHKNGAKLALHWKKKTLIYIFKRSSNYATPSTCKG